VSEIIDQSLQKIAKGTGIVFVSTIIGMLFAFGSRVLLARFFTQSEYGIFSLALIILNIAVIISTVGLIQGSTRQIAYYRGKGETTKVQGVISSSWQVALIISILLLLLLYFTSGVISTKIFHEPGLALPLKIFSIAIPFFVLIHILASIFRGFDRVEPRAYFHDILRNVLFPLLLLPIILLSLSFSEAMYAFSASIIVTCIAFAVYTLKKAPFTVRGYPTINPMTKELLLFSLPLLGVTVLNLVVIWTDTIMLGYFKTSEVVGLYNGAVPLAQLIPIALTSMGFIYVPVVSQLYSQNLAGEMKRTYQVSTKWIFSASFPLFLLLFLFPETILRFFFGAGYTEAALALRILSLGLVFHAFLGANGMTLLVMGKTRLMMWASLLAAGLNLILNIILIPQWGITGAAIASLISYLAMNVFCSVKLYQFSRIQPFTKSYLKPVIASGGIIAIIYVLTRSLLIVSYWMLPIIFILFLVIYGLCLVLTKSFDEEDIRLLLAIEKRVGVNMGPVKRILRKFL
jgi:O-antigen/teichoic acid export membrane protein